MNPYNTTVLPEPPKISVPADIVHMPPSSPFGSWHFWVLIGFIIVVALLIIMRPPKCPVGRIGLFGCSLMMFYFGLWGGKILYVLINHNKIFSGEVSFLGLLRGGGYGVYGAFLFEIIALYLFAKLRIKKLSFFVVADYIVPFMMLHQAFVRVGCFLAGCCYGTVTGLPWGCTFFLAHDNFKRHPTQIYALIYLVCIFAAMRILSRKKLKQGIVFFSTFMLYGFFRFLLGFFRADGIPVSGFAYITYTQLLSLSVFVCCFASLLYVRKASMSY